MLLESPDRAVHTAANGEAAQTLWSQREFDVLVTDVSLPGISGTELARRVLAPSFISTHISTHIPAVAWGVVFPRGLVFNFRARCRAERRRNSAR